VKPLADFFAGCRIAAIDQIAVDRYTVKRQAEGRKPATIRRELGTLVTMLRLAYRTKKLQGLPLFEKRTEGPARGGFFERAPFEAVRRHHAPDLQLALTLAQTYGWRMQSEVLTLSRGAIDLEAGTIRHAPGTTKNDEGRVVYLTPELKSLLAAQLARVDALQRQLGGIIPWLFPHFRGARQQSVGRRHVAVIGERRRDLRRAWLTACLKAGTAGRIRHDLRRTGVRNMVNAGVPERVAMKISGHKTRSVFDRYHIVSPGDLQEAARRIHGAIDAVQGLSYGHSGPVAVQSPSVTPRNSVIGG
jgi:integrase